LALRPLIVSLFAGAHVLYSAIFKRPRLVLLVPVEAQA
jgi:hypothetical protein